mgnify:CR=1 FL=1
MKWIESVENPFIKEIKKIKKQPDGKIFIEGINLVESALNSPFVQIEKVLFTEQIIKKGISIFEVLQKKDISIAGISENISKKISETVSPQGIFAVARYKAQNIIDLSNTNPTFIVILDRIQDPGNLGTIIRASEAFGAEGILITKGTCNPFSGKALRASAGSIFFIPVIEASVMEIKDFILKNRLNFFITDPYGEKLSFKIDFRKPLAIAFGNEASGVSSEIREIKHTSCKILQEGKTESLNVAISSAVLLYEILRQRSLKNF